MERHAREWTVVAIIDKLWINFFTRSKFADLQLQIFLRRFVLGCNGESSTRVDFMTIEDVPNIGLCNGARGGIFFERGKRSNRTLASLPEDVPQAC